MKTNKPLLLLSVPWDDGEVAAVAVGAAALGAVGGYAAGQSSASSTVGLHGVTYYRC
ncbi:MAG: hypothetical protein ACHBNF_09790 [Chromatiales bacterium]